MGNKLVPVRGEVATALTLYGDNEQITEFAYAVKKVAPWADQMKDTDIGLVVRRALAMGVDPLNPHEVQIWIDKGRVQFQLAYTLMAEWVEHFHGRHTEPIFEPLNEAGKDEEGIDHTSMAFRVSFVMLEDIDLLQRLIAAKFPPEHAREMVTVRGIGTASKRELDNAYFSPVGRTPAWKVQKRAVTDAYRRKFGTPIRDQIIELRRMSGRDQIRPDDWIEVAGESESEYDREELAVLRAEARRASARRNGLTQEQRDAEFATNKILLHGDDDDIDGVLTETDKPAAQQHDPNDTVADHLSVVSAAIEGMPDDGDPPGAAKYAAQELVRITGVEGFRPPYSVAQLRALATVIKETMTSESESGS